MGRASIPKDPTSSSWVLLYIGQLLQKVQQQRVVMQHVAEHHDTLLLDFLQELTDVQTRLVV